MEQYFRRNTVGISSTEFLWGIGLPVVVESTFLQLFLRNLGASSFLIGLIPTLFSTAIALFSILSGTLTGGIERKRPFVVGFHALAASPLLCFAVIMVVSGLTPSTLTLFFIFYTLFSIGVGFTLPVWQNYLVKIFSEERSIKALAVMFSVQSFAKVLSSFFILSLVERYSFSETGSSIIFSAVGIVFLSGSFTFLITREDDKAVKKTPQDHKRLEPASVLHGFGAVVRNRSFMIFLGTELEFFALIGIISFYANFATEYCGIAPALASGLFLVFFHFGGITVNVVLGWLHLFTLKNKYLITKCLSLAVIPLLCFSCRLWTFLLASCLFGASRATRMLVFPPAVKRLSGVADSTHYFALAPLLTLPLSAGIPLANGACLDWLAALGSWSYRIVFLAMGVLGAVSLVFLSRIDGRSLQPPRRGTGEPQSILAEASEKTNI
jgi:MFS family permease